MYIISRRDIDQEKIQVDVHRGDTGNRREERRMEHEKLPNNTPPLTRGYTHTLYLSRLQ